MKSTVVARATTFAGLVPACGDFSAPRLSRLAGGAGRGGRTYVGEEAGAGDAEFQEGVCYLFQGIDQRPGSETCAFYQNEVDSRHMRNIFPTRPALGPSPPWFDG